MYNLYDELLAIVSTLEQEHIEYAVCGGLAMAIHGFVRATKDIDLLIQREDLQRVIGAARRCGFNLDEGNLPIETRERGSCEIFRVSKVIDRDLAAIDLLLVNQDLQQVWDAREYYEWGGLTHQAVSAAGLYVMKKIAGRPQDLVDIEALELIPDDTTS